MAVYILSSSSACRLKIEERNKFSLDIKKKKQTKQTNKLLGRGALKVCIWHHLSSLILAGFYIIL